MTALLLGARRLPSGRGLFFLTRHPGVLLVLLVIVVILVVVMNRRDR